jgi:hypothetical protein
MALSAGNDLRLDAVRANAGGAMTLNALGNVRLDASQNWTEMTGTTTTHHLRETITTAPTELSAASVSVKAGNELSTYGTRVSSSGRVSLQAGGAANYYAVHDQVNNRDDRHKTRSFLGIRYSSSRSSSSTLENTPLVTRLQSQAELVSHSGGNTLLQGTQVRAGAGYAINAGVGEGARTDARIILEGVKTTVQQSRTAKSDYVVWQSMSGSGSTTETLALPSFAGGGTFSAPGGISVQIPEGDFKSQITSLSSQPGMGYLNDLAARKDVNWQAVKLAHDQWSYSQSGLTPAGAALLGVAVAWATGGMGASMLGTTGTATSAMAKMRKVTTVRGLGQFVGAHHLEVSETTGTAQEQNGSKKEIAFKKAIIAAGSQAVRLPFMPNDPRVVDSTGALELQSVPKRMLILGGGIIGLEMGTVYSTLGARLDVVEMMDGLMQGADRDLVKVWQKMNAKRFDNIMLKTKTVSARALPEGIEVTFESAEPGGTAPAPQVYDLVLQAVGPPYVTIVVRSLEETNSIH